MDSLEILRSSAVFADLNTSYLAFIAGLTEKKRFLTGEYIMNEGEIPDYCYLIASGRTRLCRKGAFDDKWHLAEVGEGGILGELSMIDGLPRAASAIALEPTEVLVIKAADFKQLLESHPEIALALLPILAHRLRQTQDDLYLAKFMQS